MNRGSGITETKPELSSSVSKATNSTLIDYSLNFAEEIIWIAIIFISVIVDFILITIIVWFAKTRLCMKERRHAEINNRSTSAFLEKKHATNSLKDHYTPSMPEVYNISYGSCATINLSEETIYNTL
jgi:uncharacterized membrane protein YqiK